uniref:DUF4283 domain-containing protein n=1 Tax=Cajanus cajan TaxID=3821 RepID=A0A151RQQ7_CAJCA|nr:hypothetical protein KK1_033618 [Cajanus cajan]
MQLDYEGENRLVPKFTIETKMFDELCSLWKRCLVVKILGKMISFITMREKLHSIWKLEGGFKLIDVTHGYFILSFDLEEDQEKAISSGPWMIFYHYLIVRQWLAVFVASEATIDQTLAWVCFPRHGMVYYDESVLISIAFAIGPPIKVDTNTLTMPRGRFARVCIQIDLNVPVVGKFCLNNIWYNVEYEGLRMLYTKCGCYRHVSRECKATTFEKSQDTKIIVPKATMATSTEMSNPN